LKDPHASAVGVVRRALAGKVPVVENSASTSPHENAEITTVVER